jgi:hypothetical protein
LSWFSVLSHSSNFVCVGKSKRGWR